MIVVVDTVTVGEGVFILVIKMIGVGVNEFVIVGVVPEVLRNGRKKVENKIERTTIFAKVSKIKAQLFRVNLMIFFTFSIFDF